MDLIDKYLPEGIKKRDYKREYSIFHKKPEQKKRRAGRNAARRIMAKDGKVCKNDGKDVNHKDHDTLNNRPSNIEVMDKSKNRSMK